MKRAFPNPFQTTLQIEWIKVNNDNLRNKKYIKKAISNMKC